MSDSPLRGTMFVSIFDPRKKPRVEGFQHQSP